jgi:hypothetical protein
MLERLRVTQTVPHRLRELGHGREAAMVGGASPSHLPEPLAHLQLGTGAGQRVQLQVREGLQHCRDQGPPGPGGFVDHDHHPGLRLSGIDSSEVTHMAGNRFLQIARFRPRRRRRARALNKAGGQPARHQVEGANDVKHVVTIQMAHQGAMPFDAQGGPERRNQGKACLILTHQDERTGFGVFLRSPGPGVPLPAGQDRL